MQIINMLFLKILEMSLTTGIVILFVLFVRWLIRGLPRSFAYMLWIVVAFRLIVPVSADSSISIFNLFTDRSDSETSTAKMAWPKQATDRPNSIDDRVTENINGYTAQNNTESIVKNNSNPNHKQNGDMIRTMPFIWIVGILIFVLYTSITYVQIRRRIKYSIRLFDNVYVCDNIRSPFVMGLVAPKIYLPFRLHETEQQCILAHERYHIRRRDYWIKSFAYILVLIYWFHPLVWVAYRLMCIDMEMSCDEKIISDLTSDMRKEYSRLLLAFATNKRQHSVGPLSFGEENTMKRIKNILHYKKTARWKQVGGVVILMLTMVACATDANTDKTAVPVNNDSANRTDMAESMVEEEQHHLLTHHQAQWAENSKFDLEFYSLDYADSDKIIFHISSGLFQYDLHEQKFTRSIDLKALHCQAVQTGGECKVAVYQDSDGQLKAVITPYPYADKDSYIYDLEGDELFAYDESLLNNCEVFDGFVSKNDSTVAESLRTWKAAANVLPLGDHSYGALYWGPGPDLVDMCYEAGDQKWELFSKEQATLPKLLKQDDSFYQSFSLYSGKSFDQCSIDYAAFYNSHDYDGVCALSTGLEYSDALREEFSKRTDKLLTGQEVSHSEDEKEYLMQYSYSDGTSAKEQKVYVKFKYLEGEGWRAEGLPTVILE